MNRTRAVAVRIHAVLAPLSSVVSCANTTLGAPTTVAAATIFRIMLMSDCCLDVGLQGVVAGFAGTNADRLLEVTDEYFTVPDLACIGRFTDSLDDLINYSVLDSNFDFCFWQKVDNVLGASIQFGVAFLATKSFYFGERHPADANLG